MPRDLQTLRNITQYRTFRRRLFLGQVEMRPTKGYCDDEESQGHFDLLLQLLQIGVL